MQLYCSADECLKEAVVVIDGNSLCTRHRRAKRLSWLRGFQIELMYLSAYSTESLPFPDHMLDELHELEKEFDIVGGE